MQPLHAYWKLNLGNSTANSAAVTMHIHPLHLWSRRTSIQYVTSLFADRERIIQTCQLELFSDKCFRRLFKESLVIYCSVHSCRPSNYRQNQLYGVCGFDKHQWFKLPPLLFCSFQVRIFILKCVRSTTM